MEYPDPIWQTNIPSLDLSGSPTLLVGPDDTVYWAVSSRGAFSSVTTSKHAIVLGAHNKEGVLQWILQDPKLYSGVADTQPKLVQGPNEELYVIYTTTGSTPGNKNMETVFSICGSCSTLKGPEDIVVARIDGAFTGTPTVAWVRQDSTLNSCACERNPVSVFNTVTGQLIIVYQTSGATLCTSRVGSPNIVVVAFTPEGGLAWATQNTLLNSRGENSTPSVTFDAECNLYIAYTVTSAVQGGTFQGIKDIEVVKLHTEGSPVNMIQDWVLSSRYVVNTPLVDTDPAILCDRERGIVYLAFCTNGTVPGGDHTTAKRDLVLAAFTTGGDHLWSFQSPSINEPSYAYDSVDNPALALDAEGNLYVACHALTTEGNQRVLLFRFAPNTPDTNWKYTCGFQTYRAYIPVGLQGAPRGLVFRTGEDYSPPAIAINSGNLYVGFNAFYSTDAFYLTALRQQYPNEDMTAFDYMTGYVGPCKNCVD